MKITSVGRQSGTSLIEVMISVLILSIGLLGVAAMQATALRNSQGALERSQVVIESYAILDAIRANQAAGRNGAYNRAMTCVPPTGTGLVDADIGRWITSMRASLGDAANPCGAILCVAATQTCTVTVQWHNATQQVITVGRI